MNNPKLESFKSELKAILEKYNASIECEFEGDTQGTSFTMVVEIDKNDYKICYGNSIDSSDLK
jgi:hypothetical protein